MFKIKLALLAGFILFTQYSTAQLYHKIETLTRQQGLSDNRITCVFKDKTGYLWIGTKSGLNLYDGHDFTVFNPGNGNSISNEIINAITEDADGKIWVGTMNGLNCYDPKTKQWLHYFASGKYESKTIPNPIVWSCFADADNRIWITTDRYGPSVLEKDRVTFTHFNWRQFVHEERPDLKGKYFSAVKMLPVDDEIFLGSTIGIFKMKKKTGVFKWLGEANYNDIVDMQYDDANKKVYMTTGAKEIFYYDGLLDNYKNVKPELLVFPSTAYISIMNNPVWIGFPDGLLLADKSKEKIFLQQHHSSLPATIPGGGVNTVYHDNTGIVWIATNNGLAKYDRNSGFTSFLPLINNLSKPARNPMGAVYYDKISDNYFICSIETGEVFIVNRTTGIIINKKNDATGKRFESCLAIKADQSNELWLLTANHVYQFNRKTNQFVLFPTPNGNNEVMFRDMIQDLEGNYWFAGFHSSLFFFNTKEKKFTTPGDSSLFNGIWKVNCLLSDTINKTVWAGTFNHGLYQFDLATKKFKLFTEEPGAANYSFLNLNNDLYQDKNGRVWVATHAGGLFYYVPGQSYEKSFRQVSMKDGLTSNNIYAITGNDSLLWVMSGKSISVLNNRSARFVEELNDDRILSFTSFVSDEHLPHYTDYDAKRNELLVAAGGGLMIYKTNSSSTKQNFPVLLTSLSVNGKPITDSNWLYKNRSGYNYPLKEIKISFAALHFTLPSSIQYEYKLNGFDNEWKTALNINEVIYQNLSPGNYTFQLRAKDYAGNFSSSQASFSFDVIPPFWMTWWFKLLSGLTVALIVFLWVKRLRRKIWAERKLNTFATSLYGQNTVEDIFKDVAAKCITELGFTECNIFQYDEEGNSFTNITSEKKLDESVNQRLGFLTKNRNVLVDTNSSKVAELSVPVLIEGKLFGVILAVHSKKNYFKQYHRDLVKKIAEACSTKIQRYLVEDKLRSKIARDLHDEMGSTLTSINIISKVAMEQSGTDKKLAGHLEKIKDNSSRMMESMSDMVWAINPANDTFEKVALRMKEFAAEILEPAGINYFFREEGQIEKAVLNPEQRKDVYLIFKEALNNAVKYSSATEIDIILKKENGHVIMNVVDNGKGFDINGYKAGNGLKNMQNRADQMNADLIINSIKDTGTSVSLKVPVT